MADAELTDNVLMSFYSNKDHSLFPEGLVTSKVCFSILEATRESEELVNSGFVYATPTENNFAKPFAYQITTFGIRFINKLPQGYENKPYTYYEALKEEREARIIDRENLDDKVKKLTLSGSKVQTIVTLASLTIAFVALVIPFVLRKLDENKIDTTEVPQLDTLIQKTSQLSYTLQRNIVDLQKIDSVISVKMK